MESFVNNFLNGYVGDRADDFYFKCNSKGVKYYYSRITQKRIRKDQIPAGIVNQIKPLDNANDRAVLLDLKKGYITQIELLQQKIAQIDLQLGGETDESIHSNYLTQLQKDEQRRQEYKRQQDEILEKLFERFKTPKKSVPDSPNKSILQKCHITDRKTWKKWLIANHPDRGGDVDLCQEVIKAGRSMGW